MLRSTSFGETKGDTHPDFSYKYIQNMLSLKVYKLCPQKWSQSTIKMIYRDSHAGKILLHQLLHFLIWHAKLEVT